MTGKNKKLKGEKREGKCWTETKKTESTKVVNVKNWQMR